MPQTQLKYGRSTVAINYDDTRFDILGDHTDRAPLTDAAINQKLDSPIDSPPLEDIVKSGDTILIVVPDATRQTAAGQIVNLLVRLLIANGSAPHEMAIIFATGIHRKVTDEEKQTILTPFIAQRINTFDHDPRDLARLVRVGETSQGIPIELNRKLTEYDHVVLVGGVMFHYFAGFTGGRKLICPGLASSKTVSETHKLTFDCEKLSRRDGAGTGLLDGNAVHEAFMEAVDKVNPSFAISTIVNENGDCVDLFCGGWRTSHRTACDTYLAEHTVHITEKRELVIVSSGGSPHDINLIQAHKALESASHACIDGGTIILFAECRDGLGRDDLLNWFDAADSRELAKKLCEKYQVNGQTAWSLLQKAERFDIRIVTDLPEENVSKMRLKKIDSAEALTLAASPPSGYIIPTGAKILIT